MPIDFVGNFLPSLSIRDKQEREETRFFALMVSGRFYIFLIAMRFKRSLKRKK
jgi:hypothetical protein